MSYNRTVANLEIRARMRRCLILTIDLVVGLLIASIFILAIIVRNHQ